MAPTGPLPASIDFALRRRPEAPQFLALLIADTQPENGTELGYLWAAPLRPSLTPGAHRLTVRAVDEYGREIAAHLMLEVAAQRRA